MAFTERLGVLRERNKELLRRLKQQRETLEQVSGFGQSRKREREDAAEERREPADILTLTDADRGPARAALAKPTVRFADTCGAQADNQRTGPMAASSTHEHDGGPAAHTPSSGVFEDNDRHLQDNHLLETRPDNPKSCLVNDCREQREEQSRVTFQSDDRDEISASDRHHLPPLLGYDWIAGVLDVDDSLIERSDEFFDDLRVFRSLNKDECVHSPQEEFSEEKQSFLPPLTDKDSQERNMDTHQCTFSYRINSRLFPIPLHSQESCPVCRKLKSSHPHTDAEPALIRVSIPRSALLPSYKYKSHRRCSFDSSDSLGLPSHCLSGWSNKGQSTLPPPSSLDLRTSLKMKKSQDQDLEDLSAPKVTTQQISDQITDVSRLARHNFQHFSPKRKLGSSSYPLH